jgi:hypothetical protein
MRADNGGDESPPDLRFTSHERNNVQVNRNLSTDGHLARGDKTRMSKLSFTVRARPRDDGDRDPVFVERDRSSTSPGPAAPSAIEPDPGGTPTLMQRIARFMGGKSS